MKKLIDEQQISDGVHRLASEISDFYADQGLTIVGVLTGSVVLLADLIRQMTMPLRVGVVQASSYRGGTTRGSLVINSELMPDITNHDVLIVDDIFDTGHTMVELVESMNKLKPKSIRTAVLLQKTGQQQVDFRPDFVGFDIPNEFVVGYGLDYQDRYRNLPYVATLDAAEINAVAESVDDV
ncbi:hypoxanthine phosphoribosyltransferase [Planctomycetota bacterium]